MNIHNFNTYQEFNIYFDNLITKLGLKDYLLIASGGRTPKKLYEHLAETDKNIRPKEIILGDERWKRQKYHKDSNELKIKKTGLRERYNKTTFHEILSGEFTAQKEANRFEKLVKEKMEVYKDNNLAIFGMGEDGHVAGIKPKSIATVSQRDVVFYNSKYEYKVRITLTSSFIEKYIKNAILLMTGKKKKEAFETNIYNKDSPVHVIRKIENMEVCFIKNED